MTHIFLVVVTLFAHGPTQESKTEMKDLDACYEAMAEVLEEHETGLEGEIAFGAACDRFTEKQS